MGSEAVRNVDRYNIVAAATAAGSSIEVDDCSVKGGSATDCAAVLGCKAGFGDCEGAKLGVTDGETKGTRFGCIVGELTTGLKDGGGPEGLPIGAQPQ